MTAQLARPALDIGFVTRNRERLLTFYRDGLGFSDGGEVTIPNVGIVAKLNCGHSTLKFLQPQDVAGVTAVERPAGSLFAFDGLRYLTVNITNINELCDKLSELGAPFVTPLRELRPGVHVALLQDPDGNFIELMQLRQI